MSKVAPYDTPTSEWLIQYFDLRAYWGTKCQTRTEKLGEIAGLLDCGYTLFMVLVR